MISTKQTTVITGNNPMNKQWLVPMGLILLSLVPVIAGAIRLTELSSGAEVTPANARFFTSPLPVILHIISVTLYSLLGAFQFVPSLRQRRSWHRIAGRILLPSGLTVALSGLWMAHFYSWPRYDGTLVYGLRLLFGSAMFVALLLGADTIRRRNFAQHGEWMMRAYAIALGAGTQVFTHIPYFLFPAIQSELTRAFFMGAAWVINLAVAEWIIRAQRAPRSARMSAGRAGKAAAVVTPRQ